jgi:5'-3' exonuclease
MGISGITAYLKKNAPSGLLPLSNLEHELRNSLCLVDVAIFMHQFASSSSGPEGLEAAFLAMNQGIKSKGGTPLFVFDGRPLAEKKATQAKRAACRDQRTEQAWALIGRLNELEAGGGPGDNEEWLLELTSTRMSCDKRCSVIANPENSLLVPDPVSAPGSAAVVSCLRVPTKAPGRETFAMLKDAFARHEIPFMVAENEAERDCALIAQLVAPARAIVITQDMDALVFGAPRVLRNLHLRDLQDSEGCDASCDAFVVVLDEVLRAVKMTHSQFIDASIMCGCDFTTSKIQQIGPATAFKAIASHGTIESYLASRAIPPPPDFEFWRARKVFTMPSRLRDAVVITSSVCRVPLFSWCSVQVPGFTAPNTRMSHVRARGCPAFVQYKSDSRRRPRRGAKFGNMNWRRDLTCANSQLEASMSLHQK